MKLSLLSLIALLLCACDALLPGLATTETPYTVLIPEVVSVRPHDARAFTQGLLLHDGSFYESTGQYGASTLREVDPISGAVLRQVALPPEYFAEGLALVDDRLIQLTWREGVAFVYDLATFALIHRYSYDGEGWGLCYDGDALYMTDGSSTLFVRDPATFALLASRPVTLAGAPVANLNELACVGDYVYANVWYSDEIMRIRKATGMIDAVIDASELLTAEERAALAPGAVLNGIAYDPDTGHFYLTGKYWPKLFEVRLLPDAR